MIYFLVFTAACAGLIKLIMNDLSIKVTGAVFAVIVAVIMAITYLSTSLISMV